MTTSSAVVTEGFSSVSFVSPELPCSNPMRQVKPPKNKTEEGHARKFSNAQFPF